MPYHYKKGDDLNLAIMYARGWNEAIRAAAAIAAKHEPDYGSPKYIAEEIMKLDRSAEVCDD